ncbi:hypothetical protein ACU6U9_12880 [Pseudomonas sp. HK3]
MQKSIGLLALVCSLAGCIDNSSSDSKDSREVPKLDGVWQIQDDLKSYVLFQTDQMQQYVHSATEDCYNVVKQPFSTANKTLELNLVGYKGVFNYSQPQSDRIELTSQQTRAVLKKTDVLASTFNNLCGSDNQIGTISVEIEFVNLTTAITINKASTEDNRGEFEISAWFDVNASGKQDKGDIAFTLHHFKKADSQESLINVVDLPSVLFLRHKDNASVVVNTVSVSQQEDVLTFTGARYKHPLLSTISAGTPFFVKAYHWSNDKGTRYDCYPNECDYTQGLDASTGLQDEIGEESTEDAFIDIRSVRVKVSE